jgi:hypothetical protein
VFVVTAALSALILLYYLVPSPNSFIEEHPSPTGRTDPIALSVGKLNMVIPANYISYASARQGGPAKEVALAARLPDLQGYSEWHSSSFNDNGPDSPIVYMLIRDDAINISEEDRLKRIYMSYVTDTEGKPSDFNLTKYAFRDDSGSGYHDEDLYVGQTASGIVVMRCDRLGPQVPSPSCLRDMRVGHHVAVTYRFKRSHLAEWQDIATGMDKLMKGFVRNK